MKGDWIFKVGSIALVGVLATVGKSFAESEGRDVLGGTIRIDKQVEHECKGGCRLRQGPRHGTGLRG